MATRGILWSALAVVALAVVASATQFVATTCAELHTLLADNGAASVNSISLANDVTCTSTSWTTIPVLAGTLDGRWHTVTFTSLTSITGSGFFEINSGTIKRIRFVGAILGAVGSPGFLMGLMNSGLVEHVTVEVAPGTYTTSIIIGTGWIAGRMGGGIIRSTVVSGAGGVTLEGPGNIGGFVGYQGAGTIEDSAVVLMTLRAVDSAAVNIGGFAGALYQAAIHRCVTDGVSVVSNVASLTDVIYVGGFIGSHAASTISASAVLDTTNSGSVIQSLSDQAGGFVGHCYVCTVSDSYVKLSSGHMTCGALNQAGSGMVCGGFAGDSSGTFSNSYAELSITAPVSAAWAARNVFSGSNSGTISNCVHIVVPGSEAATTGSSTGLSDFSSTAALPLSAWDNIVTWALPQGRLRFAASTAGIATIASVASLDVAVTLYDGLFDSSAADAFVGYRAAVSASASTNVQGSITTPLDIAVAEAAGAVVSPAPTIASGRCFKVELDVATFATTHDVTLRTVYGLSGGSWVKVSTLSAGCTGLSKSGTSWTFYAKVFTQYAIACNPGLIDSGSGPVLCVSSGTGGDPHFRGLAGQKYLISGEPGTVYNIISTPSLVVNALFRTAIGPHRYTVMHEIGIVVGTDTIFANKYNRLQLNGVAAPASAVLSDGMSVLTRDINKTGDGITLHTPEFVLRWKPRGYEIDLTEVKLLRAGDATVHGLLGQTWNSAKWPASAFATEITDAAVLFPALLDGSGESDYAVRDGLFGHEFAFSKFDSAAYPEVHAAPAMSKAGRKTK